MLKDTLKQNLCRLLCLEPIECLRLWAKIELLSADKERFKVLSLWLGGHWLFSHIDSLSHRILLYF